MIKRVLSLALFLGFNLLFAQDQIQTVEFTTKAESNQLDTQVVAKETISKQEPTQKSFNDKRGTFKPEFRIEAGYNLTHPITDEKIKGNSLLDADYYQNLKNLFLNYNINIIGDKDNETTSIYLANTILAGYQFNYIDLGLGCNASINPEKTSDTDYNTKLIGARLIVNPHFKIDKIGLIVEFDNYGQFSSIKLEKDGEAYNGDKLSITYNNETNITWMFFKYGSNKNNGISISLQNEHNTRIHYSKLITTATPNEFEYKATTISNELSVGAIFDFGMFGIEAYYKRYKSTTKFSGGDYNSADGYNGALFLAVLEF